MAGLSWFAFNLIQIEGKPLYAAIHQNPGLGPVFAAHVTDWPAHEAKIAAFWRNAILMERGDEIGRAHV